MDVERDPAVRLAAGPIPAVVVTFPDLGQEYSGGDSLAEAKEWLADLLEGGASGKCPCCDQNVGYEQRIHRSAVLELWRFFHAANRQANRCGGRLLDQALKTSTALGRNAVSYSEDQVAQLKNFGLVEPAGPRGWWKLTRLGRDFCIGRATVTRCRWVFRGIVVQEYGDPVGIDDLSTGYERRLHLEQHGEAA